MRILGLFFLCTGLVLATTAPGPPSAGPGSADYHFGDSLATLHGHGSTGYWLYEPANPTPQSAPVVLFLHGWNGTNPAVYSAWIQHLVRRGNVVVYPLYQSSVLTLPVTFTYNALVAVKAAIADAEADSSRVKFQSDHLSIMGHSMGGIVAANLAVRAASGEIPTPRALMIAEPGKTWGFRITQAPLENLAVIPAETLLLTLVGDDDRLVGDTDARRIFNEASAIPVENKNYVTMVSDDHGSPALEADHLTPCGKLDAPEALVKLDALDYYALWKLFDGLTDAAFFGTNRQYALGGTPEQRFMGTWSDGVPVRELQVTTEVQSPPLNAGRGRAGRR